MSNSKVVQGLAREISFLLGPTLPYGRAPCRQIYFIRPVLENKGFKEDQTDRRMTTKTASEAAGQGHGTAGCVKQRGAAVSNKLPKTGMGMGGEAGIFCGW